MRAMLAAWRAERGHHEAELGHGRAVPTLVVRLAHALLVTLVLLVAVGSVHGVGSGAVVGSLLAGGFVALRPALALTGGVLVVAGLVVLVGPAPPAAAILALVLLGHLAVWAGAVSARLTWRGRVELAVLLADLRDVAVVQAGAQVLAVVALLLGGAELGAGDVARVLAVAAGVAVVAIVLPRIPGP